MSIYPHIYHTFFCGIQSYAGERPEKLEMHSKRHLGSIWPFKLLFKRPLDSILRSKLASKCHFEAISRFKLSSKRCLNSILPKKTQPTKNLIKP